MPSTPSRASKILATTRFNSLETIETNSHAVEKVERFKPGEPQSLSPVSNKNKGNLLSLNSAKPKRGFAIHSQFSSIDGSRGINVTDSSQTGPAAGAGRGKWPGNRMMIDSKMSHFSDGTGSAGIVASQNLNLKPGGGNLKN